METAATKSKLTVKTKIAYGLGNVSVMVNHGRRREGVFAAVYGWMFKTGLALGALVAGVLLAQIGFDKKVVAVPSADTLTSMRLFFSVVPGIAFLISGLLCCLYPLSRQRMAEIRKLLERHEQ